MTEAELAYDNYNGEEFSNANGKGMAKVRKALGAAKTMIAGKAPARAANLTAAKTSAKTSTPAIGKNNAKMYWILGAVAMVVLVGLFVVLSKKKR